jgi:DNA-binding CsgD family transcriptional regulator/PAS domain-containing protein
VSLVPRSRNNQRPASRAKSAANRRADGDAALGELLLSLYRGVREPDGWLDFQRRLSNSLATVNSVLSLRWPEGTRPGLTYTYNGDAAQLPPALRAYVAIDPFVNIAEGRPARLLDLVDPAEFRASTYYREWLVPIGIEYALGLDVREAGRFHARLRLCRSRAAGEFTDADCRLVESLAPHLRLAVGLYSDLDEARSGRELYADAMDTLTLATIVLDEHGRMVHANRLAESVLDERDGISVSGDRLLFESREDGRRFRELVTRAVDQFSSSRPAVAQAMRVTRPSGRPAYELVVRPSPREPSANDRRLSARVAVVIGSDVAEHAPAELSALAVQQFFGLTPKEAALALRLAAGRSLVEAARDQGVSVNTARAHLRAIFAKTGVDRQSRLVGALLKSAARVAR